MILYDVTGYLIKSNMIDIGVHLDQDCIKK